MVTGRAVFRPEGMRAILALVALAAILAGTSCKPAGDSANPPATASSGQHPKVALIMKSLANNFFATMADGARRHQAEHAADYELSIAGIKNETDLNEQVNLVEQAVAQGAVAIVIAPADSKALVPALKRAQQQGVVIVNIDNRLDDHVFKLFWALWTPNFARGKVSKDDIESLRGMARSMHDDRLAACARLIWTL